MTSTCLQPRGAKAKGLDDRLATGYVWEKKTAAYRGIPIQECPESQGAGSIISSANDFIKWVKGFMNREGPINENVYHGLLRLRSFRNPNARKLKPYTSPVFYAAGVEVYYYRGHAVVWHNGSVSGFGSRFFFLPDFRFGAIILGNAAGVGSVASILAQVLIDEVLQVPKAERSHQIPGLKVGDPIQVNFPINGKKKKGQSGPKAITKECQIVKPIEEEMTTSKPKIVEGVKDKQPQEMPLDAYSGRFWHPGYGSMRVEIFSNRLVIDASDRSMGFTLTFAHENGQTKYTAHLRDLWEDGDDALPAEFVIEDGNVARMGLKLENAIDDFIWFHRME